MTSKVSILGTSALVPHPYRAGSVTLTQNEADTLNRAFVHSASKGLHRLLSSSSVVGRSADELHGLVAKFLEDHVNEFHEGPERLRAIENEARRIALLAIESSEYRAGRTVKEMAKEKLEARLVALAASGEIREEATRRVDAFRSLARGSLDYAKQERGVEELLS